MPGRNFLFVPGPTNVPDRILRAMHRPMEDHRSSDFPGAHTADPRRPDDGLRHDIRPRLRLPRDRHRHVGDRPRQHAVSPAIACSRLDTASSATCSSTARSGSASSSTSSDAVGRRRPDRADRGGAQADTNHEYQGRARRAQRDGDRRHERHRRRAQGDRRRPPPGAALRRRRELGWAASPFAMDAWGVDVAITGSQKGFMLPAGLGILGDEPARRSPGANMRSCARVFFDFGDMIKANATGYFPYTPSIPAAVRTARVARHAASRKDWTTSTRGITAWPKAARRRSRRGDSRCAPKSRSGTPTP